MDTVDEFLLAVHPNLTEHAPDHLAKQHLHQVQPGAVLGDKDELKSFGSSRQITLVSREMWAEWLSKINRRPLCKSIEMGVPPAVPGRHAKFDRYGSPSKKLLA
jgi:hypothetical protein